NAGGAFEPHGDGKLPADGLNSSGAAGDRRDVVLPHHADAAITQIRDVDIALAVNRHIRGKCDHGCGWRPALAAEPRKTGGGTRGHDAVARHPANAVIESVGNVEVPSRVEGQALRIVEHGVTNLPAVAITTTPGVAAISSDEAERVDLADNAVTAVG